MLRVLLVCTGNICRSPIAHGLLVDRAKRTLRHTIEVRSAGTWGRTGSPPTEEAVAAAAELGIDISAHRSSRFTADLALWADLVVTMTAEQAEEVSREAEVSTKTFTLKELAALVGSLPPVKGQLVREVVLGRLREAQRLRSAGEGPAPVDLDVADPLGLSQPAYRAVAKEIEGLIDDLVRGLIGQLDATLSREG